MVVTVIEWIRDKTSRLTPRVRVPQVSALDLEGRTIWIVDAHRGDRKRFVVHADKMLTAFVELQGAIHAFAVSLTS